MHATDLLEVFSFFLPDETFTYFDLVEGRKTEKEIFLTLEEKNNPPVRPEYAGKQILSKGFKEMTVTDFPVRGRVATLTFRRRRWQVEGETELLTREIHLTAPGTQLEREFAAFLKERG